MFFLSFVLVTPSIVAAAAAGAVAHVAADAGCCRSSASARGDRTRKPRRVWSNPIAWREAKTKASAARASFLRYGFIALGLVGALVLVVRCSPPCGRRRIPITSTPASYDAVRQHADGLSTRTSDGRTTLPVDRDDRRPTSLNGEDGSRRRRSARPADRSSRRRRSSDASRRADRLGDRSALRRRAPSCRADGRATVPAGRDDHRVRGDPADRHQRRRLDRHAREGRRHARSAAQHADHQPLLHLGKAARAGELRAAAGRGAGGQRADLRRLRLLPPDSATGTTRTSNGSSSPRRC